MGRISKFTGYGNPTAIWCVCQRTEPAVCTVSEKQGQEGGENLDDMMEMEWFCY